MKRTTAEPELDSLSMADCLMSLSRGRDFSALTNSPGRIFKCKTCNRQFPSFQALGGHRASHKKPRLMIGGGDGNLEADSERSPPAKPKTHECSICGLEFAIGQALGGHMRRHRAAGAGAGACSEDHRSPASLRTLPPTQVPVLKKSNGRRVLSLDLNLTPMENDLELEFRIGKVAPMVDCFL